MSVLLSDHHAVADPAVLPSPHREDRERIGRLPYVVAVPVIIGFSATFWYAIVAAFGEIYAVADLFLAS